MRSLQGIQGTVQDRYLGLGRVTGSLQGIQGTIPHRYLELGRVTGSLQGIQGTVPDRYLELEESLEVFKGFREQFQTGT